MRRLGYLHAAAGILLGVLIGGLGGKELWRELRLRHEGRQVSAQVQDLRVMTDGANEEHEVQYRFSLPGAKTEFSRRDSTGRTDLWSRVPPDVWQQAQITQTVAVLYLPSDPWVNHPVEVAGSPLADMATGAVIGSVIVVLSGGLVLYLAFTGKRWIEL
jgi:hypothetical protein